MIINPIGRNWPIVLVVLFIAIVLRISLSIVNRQANDDHYEVIKLILDGRSGLTMADCHECFHPKLFYYVCAAFVHLLGLVSESSRIVAGQLLNSIFGLVTIGIVLLGLNACRVEWRWRCWAFTLIALNPRFIAINGQLSNDSFAILLSTGAVYLTQKLLEKPGIVLAVASQVVLSLALMTKGTTWVVAIAMLVVFFVRALLEDSKPLSRFFAGLYAVTAVNGLASVQVAGYDFDHYDAYANMGRGQPLYFWENSSVGRPGVRSIAEGYLTFRLVDLLRDPQITNGMEIEQQHRTSVWTQLYARANFAQFEQHPPSWLTQDPTVMNIARCSLVLGLVPLFFLIVGLFRSVLRSLFAWKNWGVPKQDMGFTQFFHALVCFGYIAFIIKFTADYRDFAAIKLIYMLPGMLPFATTILDGMGSTFERFGRFKILENVVQAALFSLVASHIAGIIALVLHLANQ